MQHRTFVELYDTGFSISDASPYMMECGHYTLYVWNKDNSMLRRGTSYSYIPKPILARLGNPEGLRSVIRGNEILVTRPD